MGCSASHEEPVQQQATSPKQRPQQQATSPQQQATSPQQQAPSPQQRPQQSEKPTGKVQPQVKEEERTDPNVKPVKVDREVLTQYINLEKQIHRLEGKNVLKAVKVKENELSDIDTRVKDLQNAFDASEKQTAKEKADVDNLKDASIKKFLQEKGDYNSQFTKEQEEYLEALNKQEIIQKELHQVKTQHQQVTNELNGLKTGAGKVTELYTEQDELLAGLFNGQYGSELEYQLESQLDVLLDRKQKIGVAKYKWQNGRVLLQHAVNQLAHAVKKWTELDTVKIDNIQVRYTVATESRNSLVAAHHNITNAQRYLSSIQFPYCKPDEMGTLQRATNNIYTDMQTPDRHSHALQCYSVTHKRAAALHQWFNNVINNTILKDLDKASLDVSTKEKELRAERLRLIKLKIKKQLGEDIDLNVEAEEEGIDSEPSVDQELTMATVATDDTTEQADGGARETGDGSEPGGATDQDTAPLSLSELAPPPSMDDLFGNIDDLKKQHDQEMEEFKKTQELNKARVDQGLQEKLRARRSRRNREITGDYTGPSQ